MKKFILIDHSIRDGGGHHLEYALRVLRAAKSMGFHTILATNKDCAEIKSEYVDVVDNSFTFTFWQNHQSEFEKIAPKERNFLIALRLIFAKLHYLLMLSPFGFSYMAASQGLTLADMLRRYGRSISGKKISRPILVFGYCVFRLKAFILKASKKFNKLFYFINCIYKLMLFGLLVFLGLILSLLFLPYLVFRRMLVFRKADFHISTFSYDLRRLFIRLNISSEDIIFIPTLGNVELVGAGICLNSYPVKNLSCHFLFRRNLFDGREPIYPSEIERNLNILQSFSAFKQQLDNQNAYFYTDTDVLTEQYNQLGIFNFKTLPIPLDESLCHRGSVSNGLSILYIGDARDEKGFPLLPRLVADLRAAGYSSEDITFLFQSNFNVNGGEAATRIAYAQLLTETDDFVSLIEGPFESRQYAEIINSADIVLVPYEDKSYYARSSGVFAEALAAGIPVIARDKTWMSRELFEIQQAQYIKLLQSSSIIQFVEINDFHGPSTVSIQAKNENDFSWFIVEVNQILEKPGEFINITWKSSPEFILKADRSASFYKNFTLDLRELSSYVLMRLPSRKNFTLSFERDGGAGVCRPLAESSSGILSIKIYELRLSKNQTTYQFGSAFFSCDEDFSAATIEVIENHKQYLQNSFSFKGRWGSFHSAEVLVKMLDGVTH